MRKKVVQAAIAVAIVSGLFIIQPLRGLQNSKPRFNVVDATIDDVHKAYKAGTLTAHELTQIYLDRIKAYDQQGPKINCVITINPKALEDADKLDAAMKTS